mgnify:CR=1 FL=1
MFCKNKLCGSSKMRLEIESETYFQTKFRTVVVNVPISSRLNGYRTRQEERITGFQTERELGIIQIVSPIPTVHIDIGTQIHANLVRNNNVHLHPAYRHRGQTLRYSKQPRHAPARRCCRAGKHLPWLQGQNLSCRFPCHEKIPNR